MSIEVKGVTPMVQVFDMPRSIRFYRDLLGFKVLSSSKAISANPDDVNWVLLQLSNAEIMLNTAYDPDDVPEAPDPGRWSGHQDTCLYFGCPDVDGAYQHLVAQGLAINPPNVAWYGMKQLYLTDPDGFGICFQWTA